ncbi:MAG: SUMF1/EgtB/PvdO family nonheme iron enzyme, partial [Gemmatimonadetes bacterium]|nr:SUMF1/EgtB/PvdO family nonheme iron enzyme [Gemmatimonadota bacterium]
GVSWYEAAAYAEFRGKSLPTLRHWVQAAGTPQGGSIIPLSNLAGEALTVPGTFPGMSSFGSYDMAGNVREWLLNSAGDQRHAVGGAWSDPTYFFSGPSVQSPLDRLPTNGFRLAQYTQVGDFEGEAESDMPLLTRAYSVDQPVSEEVFTAFASQFDYDPAPLNSVIEETFEYDQGTVERVSFEGVGWGQIHGYLYLPSRADPPYQTVVWFPGSDAARLQPEPDPREVNWIQHFVAGGRAVFWPIVRSTYSRALPDQPPNMNLTWPQRTRDYVDLVRSWVSEIRRSVDYLESRPEIDAGKISYYGTSWGGRLGAIIPAVEPRFRVNMVMIGGLASGTALPEVDQINYVTRVTIPTLMLNGRHDPLQPVESSQLPMYRLLGTPEADKQHIIYEGYGHNLPPNERARETLDWLDQYFGDPR